MGEADAGVDANLDVELGAMEDLEDLAGFYASLLVQTREVFQVFHRSY